MKKFPLNAPSIDKRIIVSGHGSIMKSMDSWFFVMWLKNEKLLQQKEVYTTIKSIAIFFFIYIYFSTLEEIKLITHR